MSGNNLIPDTPFRSGITGKYKLLITGVTHSFSGYEYELIDAEGKEYKASHTRHYAEGDLLRCIVSFQVAKARLIVTETVICNKQDLATLIPEPLKPRTNNNTPSSNTPKKIELGDPRHRKTSGKYVFQVSMVEKTENGYSYTVEGAKGQQYKVESMVSFPIGAFVDCKATVTLSPGGVLKVNVKSIKAHISSIPPNSSKRKKGHSLKHWHARTNSNSWPTPSAGDHFHLIYTPMGNKR